MSNESELKARHLSFIELVKEYFIEIPKVQRDYAQGRQSNKVSEIRTAFLKQLKCYLDSNNIENDLDFIYGDEILESAIEDDNNTNKRLTVLDGQQRLTTLFLLHWYTALVAGKSKDYKTIMIDNGRSRFSYNTRESSSDFCYCLINNADELLKSVKTETDKYKENFEILERLSNESDIDGIKLSTIIKDQKWFYLNWINDLTIQSMLVMIDSISEIFGFNKEYYDRLLSNSITFYFLPLKSQGFSDDMYIRMNSRGRELTRFENLKSKFLDKFDNLIETKMYDSKKYSIESLKELRIKFAENLDTDWLDLFWELNDKNNSTQFDSSLLVFFETVFIGKYASKLSTLEHSNYKENYSLNKLSDFINQPKNIPFNEILNDELLLDLINDLTIILSSVTVKDKEIVQYHEYLSSMDRYDEKEYIKNKISKSPTYKERIIFYAYYSYLIKHWDVNSKQVIIKTDKDFEHWMRIVINLLENQEDINTYQSFVNTIYSINLILDKCKDNVYKYFTEIKFNELKCIDEIQFYEEQIKVKLICDENNKSCNWEKSILNAEKHPYFKGQIGFALSYATANKPKSFSNKEILPITAQNAKKIVSGINKEEFDRIIAITFKLFDKKGLSNEYNKDNCFRRAMTIISDSLYMRWGVSNWSLITDSKSYVHYNWKYYLKRELIDKNTAYYYMLIKDNLFDENNITYSLERICREKISNKKPQSVLIATHPQLFDMKQKQGMRFNNRYLIRWDGNKDKDKTVYILKGERKSSEHSELRTLCKYYDLKNKIKVSPFSEMNYYIVSGNGDKPCLYLDKWKVDDKYNFAIDCIWSQPKYSFILKFFDRYESPSSEWPECVLNVLKSEYQFNDGEDPSKGKILLRYVKEDAKSELDGFLENLCKSLDGIAKDL